MQAAAYYETPALIWSNYGLDVRAEIPDMPEMIAGYRIGAYALRLIGIESDAYFNYLSSADAPDLYEVFYGLSAIGGERVMDSERYAQEAAKMAALHYDRLKGKNYGKELRR